jgi:hypothetical protein
LALTQDVEHWLTNPLGILAPELSDLPAQEERRKKGTKKERRERKKVIRKTFQFLLTRRCVSACFYEAAPGQSGAGYGMMTRFCQ